MFAMPKMGTCSFHGVHAREAASPHFRQGDSPLRALLGVAVLCGLAGGCAALRPRDARARAIADVFEAARPGGWTNLFDALALALADDDVDTLYVLTDGVPSRGSETERRSILDEIAFLNRYRLVQINCIQAGGSEGLGRKWRGFLEELAEAHDGVSVRE